MDFELYFTPVLTALLVALAVATIVVATLYRGFILRPARHQKRSESRPVAGEYPAVSIIVLARDNAAQLSRLLGELLGQNYPAAYEVVVVNDGGSDGVADTVARAATRDDRVRETFVPGEAYNLSRRKLAITLGVKAARHPYVVVLDACCTVGSEGWLESMARHFAEGKEVVTGHCVTSGLPSAAMRIDELMETVAWLSPAINGRLYRSAAVNYGYSRDLFFSHKGFARSLNLNGGDDDLFINEIAARGNCAVELGVGSAVESETPRAAEAYRDERRKHAFTGRMLPKRFRRFVRATTALLLLSIPAAAAVVAMAWPHALPCMAAVALLLLQWGVAVYAWHRVSKALQRRLGVMEVVGGVAVSPAYTAREWLRGRRNTDRNYTWYTPKTL